MEQCSIDWCSRKIDHNNLCICHSANPSKSIREFRHEVGKILRDAEEEGTPVNMTDFILPKGAEREDVLFPAREAVRVPVILSGAEFLFSLEFNHIFEKGLDMSGARLASGVELCFNKCEIHGRFKLSGAAVGGAVKFIQTRFHSPAYLGRVTGKALRFENVTFCERVIFSGSKAPIFLQGVSFEKAAFFRRVKISCLEVLPFLGGASFKDALIDRPLAELESPGRIAFDRARLPRPDFREAKIEGGASLHGARLGGKADFSNADFGPFRRKPGSKPAILDLSDIRWEGESTPVLVLSYTNQRSSQGLRLRLSGTALPEDLKLQAIHWYREHGRLVLQDEVDVRNRSSRGTAEQAGIVYRRFMRHFDDESNTALADDCHVGNLEMERLDPRQSLSTRRLLEVYRMLSFYGSSVRRAAGWLVMLIIMPALLLLWTGFKPTTANGQIQYRLDWANRVSVGEWFGDFSQSLIWVASFLTLRRGADFEPLGSWSLGIVIIASILLTVQAAILVLAIRRRLMRRR